MHKTAEKRAAKSKTKQNLDSAFAGESMAHQKYLYFAKIARELGDDEVADLFEDTAAQETGHAFAHLTLIYPKEDMTVEKVLQLAVEGERYEHQHMYPDFEEQAKKEHDEAAAKDFHEQAEESIVHERRFKRMLEVAHKRFGALKKVEKMHADAYQAKLDERRKPSNKGPGA